MTMLRRVDTSGAIEASSMAFGVSRRDLEEGTSVVSVAGELDLSTAPRLKWMLIEALEAGSTRLVVDLSHASFIDSTALGVLVGIDRRLDPDGRLAIVCAREAVLQVFELSGTDRVFAIHPTLDEALAHVRGHVARAG
jgi:anti-sigma B factor antagonist